MLLRTQCYKDMFFVLIVVIHALITSCVYVLPHGTLNRIFHDLCLCVNGKKCYDLRHVTNYLYHGGMSVVFGSCANHVWCPITFDGWMLPITRPAKIVTIRPKKNILKWAITAR